MKTPIERFALRNMGLAHECMAYFWMGDFSKRQEISDRLKEAGDELKLFLKDGTIPAWMKDDEKA